MGAQQTIVEVEVISKKEGYQWGTKGNPLEYVIEIAVPYSGSIYHKLSGGTNMELRTINKDAADMFVIGETIVMTLKPKEKEEVLQKKSYK
jgi:hypothetical protein